MGGPKLNYRRGKYSVSGAGIHAFPSLTMHRSARGVCAVGNIGRVIE